MELSAKDLRTDVDPEALNFDANRCIPQAVIGQNRAVAALDFGLNIKSEGFNVVLAKLYSISYSEKRVLQML